MGAKSGRPGPDQLPPEEYRGHRINVYLTTNEVGRMVELAEIPQDASPTVARRMVADHMRSSGLGARAARPARIPEANRELYVRLAPLLSNLNQLAHHANTGGRVVVDSGLLDEAIAILRQVRANLIGGIS